MSANALVPTLFGVFGLFIAFLVYQSVKKYPEGEAKVAEIGDQIHLGAMVFMRREYRMLAWFCISIPQASIKASASPIRSARF